MSHTHKKQYQQRNKFNLVFIIEIDSSFLWCKTLAHGWSRKASTAQNVIWFVFKYTGNCIMNHGKCWWFAKRFLALNIWFHFPNALNHFKISSRTLDFHTAEFLSRHNRKKIFVLPRSMCLGQIQTL